jgi:hypothetical protein
MKTTTVLLMTVLASLALATGCEKKVQLTIANHSETARALQLSTPEETSTIGSVGAGGRLVTVLKVKDSELPAQCRLSAGAAAQSFAVTKESPDKWWFHITKDGQVTGPYGEKDVHTETEKTMDVTTPVGRETILK